MKQYILHICLVTNYNHNLIDKQKDYRRDSNGKTIELIKGPYPEVVVYLYYLHLVNLHAYTINIIITYLAIWKDLKKILNCIYNFTYHI